MLEKWCHFFPTFLYFFSIEFPTFFVNSVEMLLFLSLYYPHFSVPVLILSRLKVLKRGLGL